MPDPTVDFFTGRCHDGRPSDTTLQADIFGLCDDSPPVGPGQPAYVEESNPARWIARVENPTSTPRTITFKPVDHCIQAFQPDGSLERSCDGMLIQGRTVAFVELKEKNRDWLQDGAEQLGLTIAQFRYSHGADFFLIWRAHLANSRKPHFQYGHQKFIDAWSQAHDAVLRTEALIKL